MRLLRLPGRWFDAGPAVVLLAAGEIELIARGHGGQQLWLTLGMLTITVPLAWRRRAPLAVTCVVMTAIVVLRAISAEFHSLSVPLFTLFIPPYTVAAYEPRGRALLGLIVCLAALIVMHLITTETGSWAFVIGAPSAMWSAGMLIRRQRMRADDLTVKASRIAAEHEDRERLALADERSRIARELHAVVAKTVSAMVVQTEAAQRLLDTDAARADEAMASVEHAGRLALAEMRDMLGVLRGEDETPELAPQAGVGQIPALIETARASGRRVELDTDGELCPLPASVNLGLYRILEDALQNAGENGRQPIKVALGFREHDVELTVTHARATSPGWPTVAMRERATLCEGEVEVNISGNDEQLIVRLPREFEGALA